MLQLSELLKQIKLTKSKEGLVKVLEYSLTTAKDDGKIELVLDLDYKSFIEQLLQKISSFKVTESELNESHRRLIQSERLAAMGQMAAAVSHELRNPLTGIKVACDYLIKKMEKQDAALVNIIKNIHAEASYANSIITNILDFAKISKPQLKNTDIRNAIDEALLSVASQGAFQRIEIIKNIDKNAPAVFADSGQIKQVLTNLFINAAEAMSGGGVLKVAVTSGDNFLVITVEDTGCGISHDKLDKIFQPFFSTKIKGIGLGLSIVKEIVENHHGNISVISHIDKGTIFTIKLPINRDILKSEDKENITDLENADVNILVVDDESIVRETVAFILKDEGYSVFTAKDGPNAIELAKKQEFNVIFMDIKLPGMNGVDVLEKIKKIQAKTSVVMMTAYPVEDLIQRATELGAKGCLHKPFDMKDLLDKVKAILSTHEKR